MKFAPALGLSALSLGTSAWAQDGAPARRVDLGLSAAATYDSNFLKRSNDAPLFGLQQGERDELRLTPAVTVDVQMPLGRQSVRLNGSAGYDLYTNNSDLNREHIALTGGGNLRFSTCNADLGVTFARQQSDLADILIGERIKNAETRWLFDGQTTCPVGVGLVPTIGVEHERVENSDPLRQTGNYTADGVRASIGFSRPALGDIAINAAFRRGRYDDRQAEAGVSERIDTYTLGASFSRRVGSQLTGTVSAGYTKVDPNLPGVRPYSGPSWSADVTWTPGTRLQATFGASRSAQQSNLLNISYSIVDDYQAGAIYALGDRIRLSGGASYTRRSLRDSPLTPQPLFRDEDRAYRLRAGASYIASRRLSFSLDAADERRRSSNRLFSYDNFTVALTTRLNV